MTASLTRIERRLQKKQAKKQRQPAPRQSKKLEKPPVVSKTSKTATPAHAATKAYIEQEKAVSARKTRGRGKAPARVHKTVRLDAPLADYISQRATLTGQSESDVIRAMLHKASGIKVRR